MVLHLDFLVNMSDRRPTSLPTPPLERWPLEHVSSCIAALSDDGRLILKAITAAETNAEIASRIGISEKGTEKRITNLFAALGGTSRLEAAVFYTIHSIHKSDSDAD